MSAGFLTLSAAALGAGKVRNTVAGLAGTARRRLGYRGAFSRLRCAARALPNSGLCGIGRAGAILCLGLLLNIATSVPAHARGDFPNHPIRLVVGFAAGSTSDLVGRVIAEKLSKALGQPIIVENKVGAGGTIAAEAVARSPADGYTLLLGTGSLATNAAFHPSMHFQPLRALDPVALMATTQVVLLVGEKAPFKSFDAFVKYARAKPGEINFGSTGVGGTTHLGMELVSKALGIRMNHVPFNGTSQATTALFSGITQTELDSVLGAKQAIASGRARALAITGSLRSPAMPDVPTFTELGVPKLGWTITVASILAPRGSPPQVLDLLNKEANKVLQIPEVKERLIGQWGLVLGGGTRSAFRQYMEKDIRMWSDAVRAANIKVE